MPKIKQAACALLLIPALAWSATPGTQNDSTRDSGGDSSSESAPFFDWSKHQGETEVDHPLREKGLIRISRDKTYYYKVDRSPQKSAVSVKFGMLNATNLRNPDAAEGERGSDFGDNYDDTENPAILIDYELHLWKSPIGKWGLKVGSGLFFAQGNGHFYSSTNAGLVPKEVFTFVALPNTIGAVYRMSFWDNPLFVPYAEGGGIAWTFIEVRDDDKPPKLGASPAAYFAAGLAMNLTWFNQASSILLDREYGINSIYLTGEYRHITGVASKFDFTSDVINGGLLVEF